MRPCEKCAFCYRNYFYPEVPGCGIALIGRPALRKNEAGEIINMKGKPEDGCALYVPGEGMKTKTISIGGGNKVETVYIFNGNPDMEKINAIKEKLK